jgi:superfamily II DNA/RNA helicase
VDVLVATPGRLADLIERGACDLSSTVITVLDEADQMADLGFLPDVTALLAQTPASAQRLLFSATLDGDVHTLVKRFLTDPVTHELQPVSATVDTMTHHALLVPPTGKFTVLASIANRRGRTILFVRTQLAVDRVVAQLGEVGVRAVGLHGGKTQRVRTRTLADFRDGRVDVLVATNVAARGIHVDGVSLVVHVDPPSDPKDYLHRAGRTARAGEHGTVVTLVLPQQRKSTYTLLERAGVTAARTAVTAEGPELAEVTGARQPSGTPVPPLAPRASEAPHRAANGRRRLGSENGGTSHGAVLASSRHGRVRAGDLPRRGRTAGERHDARRVSGGVRVPVRGVHRRDVGDRSL